MSRARNPNETEFLMFLKLAMLAALGVGNYLGPTNLGVPADALTIPEAPFQAPFSDDDLRDAFRRLWRTERPSQVTPSSSALSASV
jgi:hypothetical protein